MSKGPWNKNKKPKAKGDSKLEHKIKTSDFEETELTEIPETLKAEIAGDPGVNETLPTTTPPIPKDPEPSRRLSKVEREAAELKARLDALEEADYKAYQELVGGIFIILSKRYGEHWKLDELETMALARPLCRIVAKYLGDFKYRDEMNFAILLFGIISTRVKINDK